MRRRLFCVLGSVALVAMGCAGALPEVPALSDSNQWQPGKVVWHDLVTPDLEDAREYYGALFGWTFEEASSDYLLIRNGDRLIAGMAELDSATESSYWVPLLSVKDVDHAVRLTVGAGGESLTEPFDVPGRGRVGVLRDPQGAAFGVVKSATGDPVDRLPGVHEWLWHEVWTDDVEATAAFYEAKLGYGVKQTTIDEREHTLLTAGGLPRAGVVVKSDPEIPDLWVCFVRVDDVDAVVARAKMLRGDVLLEPTDEVRRGRVAILADPHGAGFVVQEVGR